MSREGPWRFVFYCELVIYQDNFVIFVTAGIDNMELRDRVFLMAKKNVLLTDQQVKVEKYR